MVDVTLGRLGRWIELGIERGWHSSCQVSVLGDDVDVQAAWGECAGRPVDERTRFPLTCLTKPLFAIAAAHAAERSRLDLMAPVGRYVPEFRGKRRDEITIAHLLTHTAVLDGDPAPRAEPPSATLARVTSLAVQAGRRAGTSAAYSNFANWFLLGEAISRQVGMASHRYVTEVVLTPLGLNEACDLDPRPKDAAPLRLEPGEGSVQVRDLPHNFHGVVPGPRPWPGISGVGTAATMSRVLWEILALLGGSMGPVLEPSSAKALVARWRHGLRDESRGDDLAWGLGLVVDPRPFGGRCSPGTFSHTGLNASSVAFADPGRRVVATIIYDRALSGATAMARFAGTISKLLADLDDTLGRSRPRIEARSPR